jgi:hypothetical protein
MDQSSVIGLPQDTQIGGCNIRRGIRTRRRGAGGMFLVIATVASLWCATPMAHAQAYPEAGITNLRATCMQRRDLPATALPAYCDCYVDLMQKTVPWRDFLLVDSAIATKGIASLDAEEQAILGKGLQATFYCSQKATR